MAFFGEYKGKIKNLAEIEPGISIIPISEVVSTALYAKKKGLAMRLLGKEEQEESFCVQCFKVEDTAGQFPQDFWMDSVGTSDDMDKALMQVVARRS